MRGRERGGSDRDRGHRDKNGIGSQRDQVNEEGGEEIREEKKEKKG